LIEVVMPAQKARSSVFAPDVAGIHVLIFEKLMKAAMAGPAMTREEKDHD